MDAGDAPIEAIMPKGIRAGGREDEFDAIVFATGFDAVTEPLTRIRVVGRGGQMLADKWHEEGPHSYLGVAVAGFPNLFTITGPGSPSVLSNMPVSIAQHVERISGCIAHMRANGIVAIEATEAAENAWTAHTPEVANATLFPTADSWYMGRNVRGKP